MVAAKARIRQDAAAQAAFAACTRRAYGGAIIARQLAAAAFIGAIGPLPAQALSGIPRTLFLCKDKSSKATKWSIEMGRIANMFFGCMIAPDVAVRRKRPSKKQGTARSGLAALFTRRRSPSDGSRGIQLHERLETPQVSGAKPIAKVPDLCPRSTSSFSEHHKYWERTWHTERSASYATSRR